MSNEKWHAVCGFFLFPLIFLAILVNTSSEAAKEKRRMSIGSDDSDESDETEVTIANSLTSPPVMLSPAVTSPSDSSCETYKFAFPNGNLSQKFFKRSVSRQETVVSLRSHLSQVS